MKNPHNNTLAVATATAWSTPLLVTAAMVFPPSLLAIPAAGIAVGLSGRSKRKAAAVKAAEDAQHMDDCWARWNALPHTRSSLED